MFTTEMLWEMLKDAGFAMCQHNFDNVVSVVLADDDTSDIDFENFNYDDALKNRPSNLDEQDPTDWVLGTVKISDDGLSLIIDITNEDDDVQVSLADPKCFEKLFTIFREWQKSGAWPGNSQDPWELSDEELARLDEEDE